MSIWIVTTGNSDVILKHKKNWGNLYGEVSYDLECTGFASPVAKDAYESSAGYTVPARVLGHTYSNKPEYFDSDLSFPLLDTYRKYFAEAKIKLERIMILLTDQSRIFNQDQKMYEKCPYWQDTCTLEPLLEWYFKDLELPLEFVYLKPKAETPGIDNWNHTLSLVTETFRDLDYNPLKTVYVSHQAGTPAISSAVQFVSLGKFNKVEFLVSNEYFDDSYQPQSKAEAIKSSNYWRGMQIQKAQQLIIGGFPGAALKMLENIEGINKTAIHELENIVDFFNLHSPLTESSQDFAIPQATQRIVDTLDLIGFFFNQKNYLQGITLLAAAQETFLKVSILSQLALINETITVNNATQKVADLIAWVPLGLFLKESINHYSISDKKLILQKLKFPMHFKFDTDKAFEVTNRNFALIAWLKNIDSNFQKWPLLTWYCSKREANDDLRNQLMHNLRGVEDREVIDYLLGYENHQLNEVMDAYVHYVKQPFLNAINHFELPYKREKLNKRLQAVANSLI